MPSPTCEVREGAGSWQATSAGVNITTSAAYTIRLSSAAGVNSWSISCISTDESQVAATINSGLTVDGVAKTAAGTMPGSAGVALRFQSQVNGGLDENGVEDPSLTTTFVLYTLSSSRRVIAFEETTESSAFGWVAQVNAGIRAAGGGGSTPTGTGFRHVTSGTEDAATKLVENADVDAAAAIAVTKLANGTANQIVKTNSGGTALEHGLIANANVDAAAAIAGTKIAPDFGTQRVGGRSHYCTTELVESTAGPTTLNDYAIGDYGQLIVESGTDVVKFSGFAAPSAGDNRDLVIIGANAGNGFRLLHNDAGSTAANRIYVYSSLTDITVFGATLRYSHHQSRWVVVAYMI